MDNMDYVADCERWGVSALGEGAYMHLMNCDAIRAQALALAQAGKRLRAAYKSFRLTQASADAWVVTLVEKDLRERREWMARDCADWFDVGKLTVMEVGYFWGRDSTSFSAWSLAYRTLLRAA